MEELDKSLRAQLRPFKGRSFLVLHPAWLYFARDYGLRQLVVEQQHKEPGPVQLAQLLRQARALKIRTLFVQPQYDIPVSRSLAQSIPAKVELANDMVEDWPGALRDFTRKLIASWTP